MSSRYGAKRVAFWLFSLGVFIGCENQREDTASSADPSGLALRSEPQSGLFKGHEGQPRLPDDRTEDLPLYQDAMRVLNTLRQHAELEER